MEIIFFLNFPILNSQAAALLCTLFETLIYVALLFFLALALFGALLLALDHEVSLVGQVHDFTAGEELGHVFNEFDSVINIHNIGDGKVESAFHT